MTTSPVVTIPDVGGKDATVAVLQQLLYQSGIRRRELQLAMVANGHAEDEPAPGVAPLRPDGTVNSYKVLLGEIAEQERRLAEAYPEELEAVCAIIERGGAA